MTLLNVVRLRFDLHGSDKQSFEIAAPERGYRTIQYDGGHRIGPIELVNGDGGYWYDPIERIVDGGGGGYRHGPTVQLDARMGVTVLVPSSSANTVVGA